jgi:3-phenylpropionate/trans-cinnamate dioxygenase ferredoxin reductase subunit
MRLLIIGGGPAALATARAYREAGGDGDVTLLTRELSVPYTRPSLSKEYLRGERDDDDLPIERAEWYARTSVEVRFGAEVETLDPDARTLVLGSGETLHYDACVLATGAVPASLPVPGATEEWVLTLRSLTSARVLRDRAASATTAVVIGSGFIGCEAAASLTMRGMSVTLISDEPVPQAGRLGDEVGGRIAAWLDELGVTLRLGTAVAEIRDDADLTLMAAGVTPCAGIGETAGLATENGRIVVDEQMRTSRDGIYAAGDVVFARNAAAQRHLAVEHWGEALNMGAVAGRTIAGEPAQWDVAPGFWSTIGEHTLKYVAWGDGYETVDLEDHGGGAFTASYRANGALVGVLTHERDEDYERGRALLEGRG